MKKTRSKTAAISRRLLSDLQWAAREDSEYLLSARDCKALVTALGSQVRSKNIKRASREA